MVDQRHRGSGFSESPKITYRWTRPEWLPRSWWQRRRFTAKWTACFVDGMRSHIVHKFFLAFAMFFPGGFSKIFGNYGLNIFYYIFVFLARLDAFQRGE